MSASAPPSTRSTSASTVASPHSRRCSPSSQRSPGRVTGSLGGSGTSSSGSAVRLAAVERQQPLQLGGIEAEQVEIEPLVPEPADLLGQQRPRPSRRWRELVVGDDVGPLLRLGQMLAAAPPAPRPSPAAVPPAAGRGRRGCRCSRRPGSGWSSRTRPSRPRAAPPGPRCGCAGCARTGAAARPATARCAPPAPSAWLPRRSPANLIDVELRGANPGARLRTEQPSASQAPRLFRERAIGRILCDVDPSAMRRRVS